MERRKFDEAYMIHDAIMTLKNIRLEILDHNHAVALEATDGGYIYMPGLLRERFAVWVDAQMELLEKEFERV